MDEIQEKQRAQKVALIIAVIMSIISIVYHAYLVISTGVPLEVALKSGPLTLLFFFLFPALVCFWKPPAK